MTSKSSKRWLKEHFTDPYVKKAQQMGLRSRAAYKLLEIQERDHLFKRGMTVVDLGAAPGGWSQVVTQLVGSEGRVFALDLLNMDSLKGVTFIQGDFSDETIMSLLLSNIEESGKKIDWVISDMAPNISGNESIDIPRSMYLAELTLDFARQTLSPGGGMLIKVFQGEGIDALIAEIKRNFTTFAIRKPKASRGRSKEVFLLAKGFKK